MSLPPQNVIGELIKDFHGGGGGQKSFLNFGLDVKDAESLTQSLMQPLSPSITCSRTVTSESETELEGDNNVKQDKTKKRKNSDIDVKTTKSKNSGIMKKQSNKGEGVEWGRGDGKSRNRRRRRNQRWRKLMQDQAFDILRGQMFEISRMNENLSNYFSH